MPPMPGNKNSGRKKKIVLEEEPLVTPSKKKKGGRPKKDVESISSDPPIVASQSEHTENIPTSSTQSSRSQRTEKTLHVSDLVRRTSDTSIFYDSYVGQSLDKFPSSKLPHQRVVLQRYRYVLANETNITRSAIITRLTEEIMQIWELSSIPTRDKRRCRDIVEKCILNWVNAKGDVRRSDKFQKELDTLLDLRPASTSTLSNLKKHLQSTGNAEWMIDYEFFKGQLEFPQTSSISSTKDALVHKRSKQMESRKTKALLHAEKNRGDFSDASPPRQDASPTEVSEANIQLQSPRQCTTVKDVPDVVLSSSTNGSSSEETEEKWQPPLRFARMLSKKPENVTLTLPAKQIPTLLAGTSTVTKTSIRTELKMVSTVLEAGGADINDASCSVSTIHRQRKSSVVSRAVQIRKSIKDYKGIKDRDDGYFIVLHWDGKLIQLMTGVIEDRLAIAISSPNHIQGQFLASPVVPDGTGESMANCVFQKVSEFDLLDDVQAFVFDTTASNTGQWKGSVKRFEAMLKRSALWLACRHHIPELHIKHANTVIRGSSTGPEDTLFQAFKKQFGSIDVEEMSLWEWPDNVLDWRYQRANEVLIWADHHMEHATWRREDYRELLELVVVFLGGVVKRVQNKKVVNVGVTIRKPGALHRARFMASCLYLLKICLFQMQFDTPLKNLQDAQVLGEYIALLHAPYFLQTPLATSAPRNDRDFFRNVCAYKYCFAVNSKQQIMMAAVQESIRNHLWYLTAELVVFAIFDEGMDEVERKSMATKLMTYPRPRAIPPGKPVFPTNLVAGDAAPSLDFFINEKSWLLFNILETNGQWLGHEVIEWETHDEYNYMYTCLRDLKVVNDCAERCIKDITEYANAAKDSEYREDILIVATDHRSVFQDLRKQALQQANKTLR